jgi:hypothetical protein
MQMVVLALKTVSVSQMSATTVSALDALMDLPTMLRAVLVPTTVSVQQVSVTATFALTRATGGSGLCALS